MRPIIDHEHRQKRRLLLGQYGLCDPPDRLIEPDPREFIPPSFSTRDLYDLYLYEFVKALPEEYHQAMRLPQGVMKAFAKTHAVAAANSMMLLHLMTRYEPC